MSKEKPAAHQVLARKYRPKGFEELVGQPAVSQTLANALTTKRVHHAYLFTGPRGCGKTTTARILAKALNCEKGPTPTPCDECSSCREIALSSSLDVLEMDAASHTGVDDVREVIIETVALAPTRDRYKVFIIDETHMLSNSAFNALLKTIEEPPPHVVFILSTTEVHKVPATIASRCQRFKFRPVGPEPLAEYLSGIAKKEKISVEPEALALLARAAEGSLRDAISLLDQCRSAGEGKVTVDSVREMFGFVPQDLLIGVAGALLARDPKALAGWLKKIYEEGVEPAQLIKDLRAAIEGVYLVKLGAGEPVDALWTKALDGASADALGFLMRRLNRALEELRYGDSPRLALELGLFSAIEAAHDLGAWVARLEALEKRLAAGGGGSGLSPAPALTPRAIPPSETPRPVTAKPLEGAPATILEDSRGAAPAPGMGAISWPALIEAVSKTKITLGSALERAKGEPVGSGYRITFPKAFDLDMAKRSASILESALQALAGRPVALELALGAADAPAVSEIVDRGMPEPATGVDAPPGTRWKDIGEGAPGAGTGGLKNAEGVFGGKARIIKKPQS
ncbi:MAG: DNA polymerase III subunit gamma/tau [Elusimicrobia bacterium]|nr:DNA polymerase III subunit gamma/tau [Elusimicrobiota bacterium]